MIRIKEVQIYPYDPAEYGLLKARRRLARIRFVVQRGGVLRPYQYDGDMKKHIEPLLPEIFEQMRRSPYAVLPWPERILTAWDTIDKELVIRRVVTGFGAVVVLEQIADDAEDRPDARRKGVAFVAEDDVVALHGASLPRFGS